MVLERRDHSKVVSIPANGVCACLVISEVLWHRVYATCACFYWMCCKLTIVGKHSLWYIGILVCDLLAVTQYVDHASDYLHNARFELGFVAKLLDMDQCLLQGSRNPLSWAH